VLSATALLVMKSYHLMPRMRLWHVMWNACSLRESSFNSVQLYLAPFGRNLRYKFDWVLWAPFWGEWVVVCGGRWSSE